LPAAAEEEDDDDDDDDDDEEDEEEEEEEEEEAGVLKRPGVGGGRLGLMQPREASWELCRGGGVEAVRLVRGVWGGLGFRGGIAFWTWPG